MIPYPGESLAIFDAAVISGGSVNWALGPGMQKRAGTSTLDAGEEWRAWVSPGADYLDGPDVDVNISWVLEVVSGTVTLTAAEGFDPDYGNPYLAPATPLGAYTVTGPATLVIPSTVTIADVWDADGLTDSFMLVLNATAGAAVVQQIKMRVWPTAGVAGGWSDVKPSWVGDWYDATPAYHEFEGTNYVATASAQTSWDAAWAGVGIGDPLGPHEFNGTMPSLYTHTFQGRPELDLYATQVWVAAALALITGRDWQAEFGIDTSAYVSGVDWIRPPYEVSGDFTTFVQQVGTGDMEWRNAGVVIEVLADPELGTAHMFSESFDDLAVTPGTAPGSIVADLDLKAGFPVPPGGKVQRFLNSDGRFVSVSITHSSMLETGAVPGWPGTSPSVITGIDYTCQTGYTFGVLNGDVVEPMQSRVIMPPYRFWSPTVKQAAPHQIFQRHDGLGAGASFVFQPNTRQSSGSALAAPF